MSGRRGRAGAIIRSAAGIGLGVFLVLLMVLGGASREGWYAHGALQVLGALLIAAALALPHLNAPTASGWTLLALAGLLVLLVLLQLAPLPAEVWTSLPGRERAVEGFAIVGMDPPSLPISLAPEETVFHALGLLPPLAALVLALRAPWRSLTGAVRWTLVLAAAASVALGVAQVASGVNSALYVYEFTAPGSAVGFMANPNHLATLLLMSLPFVAALHSHLVVRSSMGERDLGLTVVVSLLGAVIVLGVLMVGSVAGYVLLGPVIALSLLITRSAVGRRLTAPVVLGVSLVAGGLGYLVATSPILPGIGIINWQDTGTLSRPDSWARTLDAARDVFPFGSGFGSFERVIPAYEDPSAVTAKFLNHAHNDYLEVLMELGLPGSVLVGMALIWWGWRTFVIWRKEDPDESRLRRAAAIAVLVVILHSLVDYPLRTPAVAGWAALCMGLMCARRESARASVEPRAARHLVI
jgi:O-antigen ligase